MSANTTLPPHAITTTTPKRANESTLAQAIKNKAQKQYRENVQKLREALIVAAVNRLLATKGYDSMTVDAVANEAGIAKASLYKHFPSKEALAAVAMVRVLDLALAQVNALRDQASVSALNKLKSITRWAMVSKLQGEMPSLPAQNSQLSQSLQSDQPYMERLFELSTKLGLWVSEAQHLGQLRPEIPVEMVLYMIFARACDPVLEMMQATGRYPVETIVAWMITAHFDGLAIVDTKA
jgi:TetR/AcrR family transcriptional regulator of autoinduction and epiphytic fitness